MAYSQDQVDALRAALARGVTRVRMNGEEVQYGSLAEMRRQLREMEAELAGAPVSGPVVSYLKTSRGL
ncbi:MULTISPECIES: phage head-tail joining protein [Salipiger]|uniref:phage head-tail joining protein n=1 Tax=Salipiger TaxID=263377 RepID=UPI003511CC7F